MDMKTANRMAQQWVREFGCSFYIIEIDQEVYDVSARISPRDRVVGAFSWSNGLDRSTLSDVEANRLLMHTRH